MRIPDPFQARRDAQQLRRETLAGLAEAVAVKWPVLVRRARASLSRTATCPVPERNHHPA